MEKQQNERDTEMAIQCIHSRRAKNWGGEHTQSGRTLDELAAFLRPENLLLKVLHYLSLRQLFVGRYHNGFYVEPPSPYVSLSH